MAHQLVKHAGLRRCDLPEFSYGSCGGGAQAKSIIESMIGGGVAAGLPEPMLDAHGGNGFGAPQPALPGCSIDSDASQFGGAAFGDGAALDDISARLRRLEHIAAARPPVSCRRIRRRSCDDAFISRSFPLPVAS